MIPGRLIYLKLFFGLALLAVLGVGFEALDPGHHIHLLAEGPLHHHHPFVGDHDHGHDNHAHHHDHEAHNDGPAVTEPARSEENDQDPESGRKTSGLVLAGPFTVLLDAVQPVAATTVEKRLADEPTACVVSTPRRFSGNPRAPPS